MFCMIHWIWCVHYSCLKTYRQSSRLWSAGPRVLSPSASGSCRRRSGRLWTVCQAEGCSHCPSTTAETCPLRLTPLGGHRQEGVTFGAHRCNNVQPGDIFQRPGLCVLPLAICLCLPSYSLRSIWTSGHDGTAAPPAGLFWYTSLLNDNSSTSIKNTENWLI